ncbi:MAG TPA: hypothetical protein GXX14_09020 [Clostridiaceae bacterium]|nr:hypothetical protein [Clostridiaceae bacterium]
MKVANVLKDSLSKSKGYGYVIYNDVEDLITSSLYLSEERFFENNYEKHIGFSINLKDNYPITYTINVFQANKTKELHNDIAIEVLKAIFDNESQKAISEFNKRLEAAIKGEEVKEEWITINGKPVRFGATGYDCFMISVWKYKPEVQ